MTTYDINIKIHKVYNVTIIVVLFVNKYNTLVIIIITGVAEIVGGWMIWSSLRGGSQEHNSKKPYWYAILGSIILIIYGFIPCLQPTDSFGRIYAIYGGFFIVLSFLFGWCLDGNIPDLGDWIGGCIALSGVFIIMFWPRE